MKAPDLSRRAVAIAAGSGLLVLAGAGAGVGLWLRNKPVLHLAATAQECINAPDHVASLFSDDQNTLIRISNLEYSDIKVLRVEPAGRLPGMFDSLLALSSDSKRLAYVTADNEQMDNSRIQYLDVGSPGVPVSLTDVERGLAPVRPAWSLDNAQLAYVVGRTPSDSRPAGFEVWSVRADGLPSQKVADLPVDVFARGHSASLCWTRGGQIGLLQGVESAKGPLGPSPLTGANAARAARTETQGASPSPPPSGSPCGVPVFSQNDPSWRQFIMQTGGDPIGSYGCALTSTTMLLNYYGAFVSPADLNSCLGPGADPIVWQAAPVCTSGKVQGGERADFSWEGLDAFLKAGKPVIVGMVRGITGMHFVVVTQGGGGEADNYRITDPWDGTTTKSLGSYTNVGYNPRWIISYDGPGKTCGRLVPASPLPVQGFRDGGTYNNGVTVNVPSGGGQVTVQQVPAGQGGATNPSPSPSTSPAPSPSPSVPPSISPSPTTSPTSKPSGTGKVWHLKPGAKLPLTDDGIYQVYFRHPGSAFPPVFSILKFTIDRTPPVLSLQPLNARALQAALLAFRPFATDPSGIVLDRPGKLRLRALDTLSGVDSIEYRLDGSDWTAYSDDVSFGRTLLVPTVGTHTISIRARDVAGNTGELDDQSFDVVDTTPSPSPSDTPTTAPTRRPTAPPTVTPKPTPTPTPAPPPVAIQISTLSSRPSSPANCSSRTFVVTVTVTDVGGPGSATAFWIHNRVAGTPFTLSFPPTTAMPTDSVTVTVPPGALSASVTDQLEVRTATGPVFSNVITLTCFLIG